jgi:hypothetical protein
LRNLRNTHGLAVFGSTWTVQGMGSKMNEILQNPTQAQTTGRWTVAFNTAHDGFASRLVLVCVALAACSSAASAGFEVFTSSDNQTIGEKQVYLRFIGAIDAQFSIGLKRTWSNLAGSYDRVLLDLDSPGGTLAETEKSLEIIAEIRGSAQVDTLVRNGSLCASACVAVYMQGEERIAGGASVWLFHGACYGQSNVPSISLTKRFLDILAEAGVSESFLCWLVDEQYVLRPGNLWLSGYELFHVYEANIITRLLEPWQPDTPYVPSPGPHLDPH